MMSGGSMQDMSEIIQKTIDVNFELQFDYVDMNKVMRLIKEKNINIVHQEMNMNCNFEISIRKKDADSIKNAFENLRCVQIKVTN